MISIKKYLDSARIAPEAQPQPQDNSVRKKDDVLSLAVEAYRSALREMGNCSVEACAVLGPGLKQSLGKLEEKLSLKIDTALLEATQTSARELLQDWGRSTASHYRQKTGEVKDLLIVMARTAESAGECDQRCAAQINLVTAQLESIASLEDLAEIRLSVVKSAADLKASLERMAVEGKGALDELRAEVERYQIKLEEAEEIASRDALTGLRNRHWVESQIEQRISAGTPISVAIVDIDEFKYVNDEYGHIVGDQMLQQFAIELKSASRSTDLIGRWGGDEFILLLDSGLEAATAQVDRLSEWVCGNYDLKYHGAVIKLKVVASIGLSAHESGETMKELLVRADDDMYLHKAASRVKGSATRR